LGEDLIGYGIMIVVEIASLGGDELICVIIIIKLIKMDRRRLITRNDIFFPKPIARPIIAILITIDLGRRTIIRPDLIDYSTEPIKATICMIGSDRWSNATSQREPFPTSHSFRLSKIKLSFPDKSRSYKRHLPHSPTANPSTPKLVGAFQYPPIVCRQPWLCAAQNACGNNRMPLMPSNRRHCSRRKFQSRTICRVLL
jgi:hypothetical protein